MARERLALVVLLAALVALAPSHSARAAEPGGMRLLGTVVSSDTARSLAVIEHRGTPSVVRTGAELDGAQVIEIRSDAVLLRRGKNIETLTLASLSRGSVTAVSTLPASPDVQEGDTRGADAAHAPPPARAPAPVRRAARQASSRPSSAPAKSAAPSEAEIARSNDELLANLAAQARFAPVMDNDGKLRGVAVMNIVSDSMLERLGLQSDDVIVAIQGTKIDNSGRAMNVARGLSWSQPARLDVERHGLPVVVVVNPGSLQRH